MGDVTGPRVLAIMGSGETSPTMVTLHKELAAMLPGRRPSAVLLETPYGFQRNADEISAKAITYFADSVALEVTAVPGLRAPASGGAVDHALAAVRAADWLFAGPGSPTYALDQWQGSALGDALVDRVTHRGGVTIFSSAAACTVGAFALPVYEIYKVGAAPHWRDGLDLLGSVGLPVALIPHFDNAEGGTHDTRYCYLGEERLVMLEALMPAQTAVLGVDEHTALVLDLSAGTVRVHGRGGVTVRRHGQAEVLPAGTLAPLEELAALVRGSGTHHIPPKPTPTVAAAETDLADASAADERAETLPEVMRRCERVFDAAATAHDGDGMARAVLELDDAVHAWRSDTTQSDEIDRARAVLRSLIVRLGTAATGPGVSRDTLRPAVDALVALRRRLRSDGDYAAADAVRDALTAATVEIRDTPESTDWGWRQAE
jgi:hypothetical protein